MDEKSFLLFLSLFLTNRDLTRIENPSEEDEPKIEEPSTNFISNPDDIIETYSLLFEG